MVHHYFSDLNLYYINNFKTYAFIYNFRIQYFLLFLVSADPGKRPAITTKRRVHIPVNNGHVKNFTLPVLGQSVSITGGLVPGQILCLGAGAEKMNCLKSFFMNFKEKFLGDKSN
jgi:hypothetical protein